MDPVSPMFVFVCGRAHQTAQNVLRDGEFVVNIPGADIGEAAERTATAYGGDVDEIIESGLTAIPSKVVRPPRIKECKAHFECTLEWFKEVDKKGGIFFCRRIVSASGDREALIGDIESKMRNLRPIYTMPWNIVIDCNDHIVYFQAVAVLTDGSVMTSDVVTLYVDLI